MSLDDNINEDFKSYDCDDDTRSVRSERFNSFSSDHEASLRYSNVHILSGGSGSHQLNALGSTFSTSGKKQKFPLDYQAIKTMLSHIQPEDRFV